MKRAGLWTGALVLAAAVVAWVSYPTDMAGTSYSSEALSRSDYVRVKQLASDYAKGRTAKGVELRGDTAAVGSLSLYCRNVPLMTVFEGPGFMVMQTYPESAIRTPSIEVVAGKIVEVMEARGEVSINRAQQSLGKVNALVLKLRDGIDLSSSCE